jgi:antitoxin (DNA-binding transcriptional repressor) of toxin-antitoxin stability system
MMELRNSPGEILDKVSEEGETYIIERKGELLACLVPVELFQPNIKRNRLNSELDTLGREKIDYKIKFSSTNEVMLLFTEKIEEDELTIRIVIPHKYPYYVPRVYVEPLKENAPHTWTDGALCIYGAYTNWNPGEHSILTTLQYAKDWLRKYEKWKVTSLWQ